MTKKPLFLLVGLMVSLVMAACGGDDDDPSDGPTIRIRGQAFSESETIAQVYAQYLEAKGYDVEVLTADRRGHRFDPSPRPSALPAG